VLQNINAENQSARSMKDASEELFAAGMVHLKGLLDIDDLMVLRAELLTLHSSFDSLPDDVKTKTDRNNKGEIREISGKQVGQLASGSSLLEVR